MDSFNVSSQDGNKRTSIVDYTNSSSTDLYNEETKKQQMKKLSHNEAEKKRIRAINTIVDDIREILDEAKINHKSDKVSTLEAATLYLRGLLKERDQLISTLGYIGSRNPNDDTPIIYDENEYPVIEPSETTFSSSKKTAPSNTTNSTSASHVSEMPPPTSSLQSKNSRSSKLRDSAVDSIDYKKVWISNTLPTVTIHIETGQLLKGNDVFMKLFQYESTEELNRYSLFDIVILDDLSLFWSEYSKLVNCNHHIIRSFIATVTNASKNVSFPCLLTMGPIMDYEGYVFQVSVSFTILKKISGSSTESNNSGQCPVSLEKII